MELKPRITPSGLGAAVALTALGSALWVEHASRQAERRHHAPHHHLYIDGTRLHYRLVGEGPPVLLVHGNLVDGADFEASGLLARLADNHQVLVIDRPGFGHSDRPRGIAWTPARQARLLHRAAAALGMHRPVIVGHSIGTQVAVAMALQEPADVAGLVLVSGYYWPSLRLDRWMVAPAAVPVLGDLLRYTTSAWTARATLGATLRAIFAPGPVPEQFRQLLPDELLLRPLQQRAIAEDGARMVAQARALRPHYGELRVPVTLVAGSEDRIVSPQQSVRLHRQVPRGRLRLVSGVGHMAHYHAHAQILAGVEEALAAGRPGLVVPDDASGDGQGAAAAPAADTSAAATAHATEAG
ncbi:MAG TPA: alpha/beta hydrolase [Ramlibacter sp.]|jgi:pimeloyl-ACP methyl ester carboxylesterase|uniref:alpha/beta fold hydrolase n=1 Tax=Ramlibacter sp. TaxID=1917967 RepID=UPI002D5D7FA4|nr:alpha/beta hydrolase [Ramlibacter sp.]HZY19641.1 alpha/beta hydrolase [Ramlibacter sp.]